MKPYNDYNAYLKNRFGCKVYKIGLDAGLSCPNRDGTKGSDGCVYCNETGSRSSYTDSSQSVENQISSRIEYIRSRKGTAKFIAYFQAFTNTYAPVDTLQRIYDKIMLFEEIVGLSIGTRPDAVDRSKLQLISSYKKSHDVWIEYGLQSIHDKTLMAINRGHNFADFMSALRLTEEYSVPVCAHIILGLPNETTDDMIATAKKLSELNIAAVKIHLFHILRGSAAEKLYNEGKIKLLEQDEYVNIVCEFLENLSPDIIIQRLTGEGNRKDHIAPIWALDKNGTIDKITGNLELRGSFQGKRLSAEMGEVRSQFRS